jgi:hypothetical protein
MKIRQKQSLLEFTNFWNVCFIFNSSTFDETNRHKQQICIIKVEIAYFFLIPIFFHALKEDALSSFNK